MLWSMQVRSKIKWGTNKRKKMTRIKRQEIDAKEEKPNNKGALVDPVGFQMKYSRLHSLTEFCKSMSFLKELSKSAGYAFSFIWLVRCDCFCWYRNRVMMPMMEKMMKITTAITPVGKGGQREKGNVTDHPLQREDQSRH